MPTRAPLGISCVLSGLLSIVSSLEDINAAIETWSRHTGLEDCSSSIVTATAAFAERRTFRPSTSATKLKSI
jgi:hypothetical protein